MSILFEIELATKSIHQWDCVYELVEFEDSPLKKPADIPRDALCIFQNFVRNYFIIHWVHQYYYS